MPLEALQEARLETIDCELNLIIWAQIAIIYSRHSDNAPQRAFATAAGTQQVHWRGDSYSVRLDKRDDQIGVTLIKTINAVNGGGQKEAMWFPLDQFDVMKFSLKGVKL